MRNKLSQNRVDKKQREREAEKYDSTESDEEAECGLPCFTLRIRQARKPRRFKLTAETPKYDGTQEPEAWLDDYLTMVRFQKGKETTVMQYIQLQMVGAARIWLKSRRKNSYDCWEDFEDDFIKSLKSTCKRPATVGQLKACKQRSDENLRGYI